MDGSQLAQLEGLAKVLYGSNNEAERNQAQQQLLVLQSSPEYIPQCQYILDNSTAPYALVIASNSLTKLITTHWNNFSVPQRVDIRNYILNYLAQKGPGLEKFVNTSLIQLVCRITKLGWFDDEQHRAITQEVNKFLQATVEHCIIGLQILIELVTEMNQPTGGRTLTQNRKTSVSFRDASLYQIFQVPLTTLRQLHMRAIVGADSKQEARMTEYSLDLAIKCLSFDFIGTCPDESGEDVGAIQAPTTWRPIFQEPATMEMLFHTYKRSEQPISAKALEVLVLIASVRRSLFLSDKDLARFLTQLVSGIREILQSQTGLNDAQNYHEFCRLLGRLKTNYQLSELVKTEGYREWMELAATFTVNSFQQWQFSSNSIHYILALWVRLVAAVPFVQADAQGRSAASLDTYVPRVIQAYVQSRLDSVEAVVSNDTLEDPLEDDGNLKEQLEKLPSIMRYQYEPIAQYLILLFDPLLQQYKELMRLPNGRVDQNTALKIQIVEGKMTWLCYLVGSVIGGHAWSNSAVKEGDELIDADLSRRVFELMRLVEYRTTSSGGQSKCDMRLELALLFYCNSFRKAYIGEQHGMVAPNTEPTAQSSKQKTYLRMFERMGLGDHYFVINMIVTKIGNNLKFWADNEDIIGKTLELFLDIVSGYGSGKLLLALDTVQYLIQHHTVDDFPFLGVPGNMRHRTTFYATLSRMLLQTAIDDSLERFELFIQPVLATLAKLNQTPTLRAENVKPVVMGILRDLRGICSSTHNRRTYSAFFDYLYPAYFPLLVRVAKECYDDCNVTTALLQFMNEFANNKAQRVMFDQSSANGILLFREISDVIVAYGRPLLGTVPRNDLYKEKYKGISLSLNILSKALGGNYVNFGVFALYNDKALDNALEMSLQLVLTVPLQELMSYPKLTKSFFGFLEILFRNHSTAVMSLETPVFCQILTALHEGLNSLDQTFSTQSSSAIDHLATYYFQNQKKDSRPILSMKRHLSTSGSIFTMLLSALFNILIYGEISNQWALSRPILSLALINKEGFQASKQQLILSQSPQNQARLEEAFGKLFTDIRGNLEGGNRDKFTQKISQFRTAVKAFLTGA